MLRTGQLIYIHIAYTLGEHLSTIFFEFAWNNWNKYKSDILSSNLVNRPFIWIQLVIIIVLESLNCNANNISRVLKKYFPLTKRTEFVDKLNLFTHERERVLA